MAEAKDKASTLLTEGLEITDDNGVKYHLKGTLGNDELSRNRGIKTKEFDFLMGDFFDVFGKDFKNNDKLNSIDPEVLENKFVGGFQNLLQTAKGLLKSEKTATKKTGILSAQWVTSVNPFTFTSLGAGIMGDEETKRILLMSSPKLEKEIKYAKEYQETIDEHPEYNQEFVNNLAWLLWGTTGNHWAKIHREVRKDGLALNETAYLGNIYTDTYGEEGVREQARNILFHLTNPGDTLLVIKLYKDNIFADEALKMGRHVVELTKVKEG